MKIMEASYATGVYCQPPMSSRFCWPNVVVQGAEPRRGVRLPCDRWLAPGFNQCVVVHQKASPLRRVFACAPEVHVCLRPTGTRGAPELEVTGVAVGTQGYTGSRHATFDTHPLVHPFAICRLSILLKKVGGGVSALFRESSSSSSSFSSTQTLRKSRTRTKDEDGYDGRWGVCPMQLLFGGTFSAESFYTLTSLG
jgi:hypothetical protein